ncbi:MAG: glycoside hydrolase family 13 protein [Clostridia bacterium]|nr:glycoside hydrolase family 13 protein [Clostridia bacterium]
MRIHHHSRSIHDRNPQGALSCGAWLTLSIDFSSDNSETPHLYWCDNSGIRVLPMEQNNGRASVSLAMPSMAQRAGYCFCWFRDGQTFFYGGSSGEGHCSDKPELFGVTVYDASFSTPEWFRHAVVYQIFPDRFYCSDQEAFLQRAEEYRSTGRSITVHQDWNEEPLYLPHAGAKFYQPDDYFGGDLEGIRQKLPYLASLGVTCLYLNPIFAAHSNHRYNTADYMNIDPLLGTNEDFSKLAAEAKEHGIRIVLDGVFSHTGDDSIYFDHFQRYGNGAFDSKDSPYYSWYRFRSYPNDYECWWNFRSLPDVEEMTPSYQDFIQGEFGVLRTWLRRGASGWRLDVADELPDAFIQGIRRAVKYQDPDSILLGEVWEDCSTKLGPEGRRGYCNGDNLDSSMNYPFLRAARNFFLGKANAYELSDTLQILRENYPRPFFEACLNLIGSHDIGRAISAYSGAPDSETTSREEQIAFSPSESDLVRAKKRYAASIALMIALPGVPCIYYGDEAGQTGLRDPFNRKTYPWGNEDQELIKEVSKLLHIRTDDPVLLNGRLRMGAVGEDLFAVIRYTDDDVTVILVNRSDREQLAVTVPSLLFEGPDGQIPVPLAGCYTAENGETFSAGLSISVPVPPCGYRILKKDKPE